MTSRSYRVAIPSPHSLRTTKIEFDIKRSSVALVESFEFVTLARILSYRNASCDCGSMRLTLPFHSARKGVLIAVFTRDRTAPVWSFASVLPPHCLASRFTSVRGNSQCTWESLAVNSITHILADLRDTGGTAIKHNLVVARGDMAFNDALSGLECNGFVAIDFTNVVIFGPFTFPSRYLAITPIEVIELLCLFASSDSTSACGASTFKGT